MMKIRKQLRVSIPLAIKYKLEDDHEFKPSSIEDISWGGVFLLVEPPPGTGQRIIVQLEIPEDSVRLEIWGTVVRVRDKELGKPAGVGIEFDELDHETRSQIQNLVDYWIRLLVQKYQK